MRMAKKRGTRNRLNHCELYSLTETVEMFMKQIVLLKINAVSLSAETFTLYIFLQKVQIWVNLPLHYLGNFCISQNKSSQVTNKNFFDLILRECENINHGSF